MPSTLTQLLVLSVAVTTLALPTPSQQDNGDAQVAVARRNITPVNPSTGSEIHSRDYHKLPDNLFVEQTPELSTRSENPSSLAGPVPVVDQDADDLNQLHKRGGPTSWWNKFKAWWHS